MIDIHAHLLYGIDDGCKTVEESLKAIESLASMGITDIILTPHYIANSKYQSTKKENLERIKLLKNELKTQNIKVNLYLGNEIFIDDNIDILLQKKIISSLNDSAYLLIELPMNGEYVDYEEIFRELIGQGKKIILAHPERYFLFQKDYEKIKELEMIGVLFQCNIGSIIGKYGNNAKKMVKRLLKEKKISFLATDFHHPKDCIILNKALKKINKYLDQKEYEKIMDNAKSIIINK